jgi:hypothetical protein
MPRTTGVSLNRERKNLVTPASGPAEEARRAAAHEAARSYGKASAVFVAAFAVFSVSL